jgi:hypothetical protein
VIPISSALIVVGEAIHLVDLLRASPMQLPASEGPALADGLH